ncbi:MAG: hypothetical protein NVSMB25_23720 [Thermoleophilaceae bacterium]
MIHAPAARALLVMSATRTTLIATAAAAVLLTAGCGSSGGSHPGPQPENRGAPQAAAPTPAAPAVTSGAVRIVSFKYMPETITVKKGGRVTFANNDQAAHTATADDRSFDSQTLKIGASKSVTFTSAGTFPYHCDFHPFMKATVVVR